ncbi:MAG: dTDP-4-dehydrorhamnose reductase [Kordiimonadales bacterium]|nr:MAG: dTDP-4-dehydrorhamnose reductase [Kordiimonadales bacterium]
MRIFVAGSSGQVARSLVEAADKAGIELRTAGRPELDLSDMAGAADLITAYAPTVIINAAAYTAVDTAETDEENALSVNTDGAATLAEIAADLDVPFLHLSTDYVFDGDKDEAYTESDAVGPTGAYGRTKLAGEVAVLAANPNAAIFRTAWVYSPFGKNFCKTMLMLAKTRDTLGVVADQFGNPTYAPDIANALLSIARAYAKNGSKPDYAGLFHLAGAGDTSWHGFATEIFNQGAAFDHPVPTVNAITTAEFPTPAKRPENSRLDCSKLRAVFGITLPNWQKSTEACVKRLFESGALE